jgi:hypothetical protein
MMSFLSYVRNGEDRDRVLGCRIYPFGIPAEGIEKAKSFARTLIDNCSAEEVSATNDTAR